MGASCGCLIPHVWSLVRMATKSSQAHVHDCTTTIIGRSCRMMCARPSMNDRSVSMSHRFDAVVLTLWRRRNTIIYRFWTNHVLPFSNKFSKQYETETVICCQKSKIVDPKITGVYCMLTMEKTDLMQYDTQITFSKVNKKLSHRKSRVTQ